MADAFFVYLWNTSTPTGEGGAGGYAIAYDEFTDEIQLNHAGSQLAVVTETNIDNSAWRAFKVEFDRGIFAIYLDDVLKLSYDDSANYLSRIAGNLFGFGARTASSNNIHRVRNMAWVPHDMISLAGDGAYNPVVELTQSGTYVVSLRVQSEFGKWGPLAETIVTVIDGKLEDKIRAADLRTPVEDVTITFRASRDGYETSVLMEYEVTVLGDRPEGSVSEFVSIPNVNYLVLHDPPGDGSYSCLEDSMTIKGLLGDVTIKAKGGREIPVYPSPWSDGRDIDDADFDSISEGDQDLGTRGLLGYRDSDSAVGHYFGAAVAETLIGAGIVATGPIGYGLQIVKLGLTTALFESQEYIQYEVSPNRTLRTPVEDEIDDLPDKMGPGKGDIYYGEGWTLGLQTKYRLGIKQEADGSWVPDTALILTYDIMDVNNQYVYTVTDIERIISELDATLSDNGIGTGVTEPDAVDESVTMTDELRSLINARTTWKNLLEKNPAYVWRRDYVEGEGDSGRDSLQTFREGEFNDEGELLLFTGGSEFEYSRTIREINVVEYSSEVAVSTESSFSHEFESKVGALFFGTGATVNLIRYRNQRLQGLSTRPRRSQSAIRIWLLHAADRRCRSRCWRCEKSQ